VSARLKASIPRTVVHTALLTVLLLLAGTGTVELFANGGTSRWVYLTHRAAAVALLPLLMWKVPIAVTSFRRRGATYTVWPGLLLAIVVLSLVVTGWGWLTGLSVWWSMAGNSFLALHLYLLFVIAFPLVGHVWLRWERPRVVNFLQRRSILRLGTVGGLGLGAALLLGGLAPYLTRLPVPRRFTGSLWAGHGDGNAFPETAFLMDAPPPVDVSTWRLAVTGHVGERLSLGYDDLSGHDASVVATVDCTGGWCAERSWHGVPVHILLDATQPVHGARAVLFRSLTGHWTLLPLDEARRALLATRVGGEVLAHGHGFPLRLVVPERRGFQWVKWVTEIQVLS